MRIIGQKNSRVVHIPIVEISPNPHQPRRDFNEDEMRSLADSIRANGVLQPLNVRKLGPGEYELISGERRLRASAMAGLQAVPCIIINCDDRQSAILALLENIQRADLGPFEQAEGIYRLISQWGITQEEAAARLGKKQSTVANKLRLLRLTSEERDMITAAGLTERHARALLKLEDSLQRKEAIRQIIERELNVQQTEKMVDRMLLGFELTGEPTAHRTVILKDVRIFINTISKAVETMRQSGIPAVANQRETDDFIECVVRIPKEAAGGKKPA